MSESKINWKKGLRRVWWVCAICWWTIGVGIFLWGIIDKPRSSRFDLDTSTEEYYLYGNIHRTRDFHHKTWIWGRSGGWSGFYAYGYDVKTKKIPAPPVPLEQQKSLWDIGPQTKTITISRTFFCRPLYTEIFGFLAVVVIAPLLLLLVFPVFNLLKKFVPRCLVFAAKPFIWIAEGFEEEKPPILERKDSTGDKEK